MAKQAWYSAAAALTLLAIWKPLLGAEASKFRRPTPSDNAAFPTNLDHRRSLRQDDIEAQFDTTIKIIGGAEVKPGAYKFIASLRYPDGYEKSGTHYCGGSLIASNVIVTAAHCVQPLQGRDIDVHLGRSEREGGETGGFESYRTVDMRVHPSYNKYSNYNYDIALLVLNGKTNIIPVKMRTDSKCFDQSASCGYADVFGWGLTDSSNSDSYASVLMSVRVPLVGKQKCLDIYSGTSAVITDNMVCAGGVVGEDSCGGDSGGPLLINNQLSGVVSFGPEKCGSEKPGVYSSIPYFFDWIDDNLYDINGVGLTDRPPPSPSSSPSPSPSSGTKVCKIFRYGRMFEYKC